MNDMTGDKGLRDASYTALEKALREQVARQPDLLLARVMLLELYFKAGRRSAFLAEARKLYRRVENPIASLEWQRCAKMGRLLDPDAELFRSGSAELLEAAETATASAAVKMRRFGEQPEYAHCFLHLAQAYESALKDSRFLAELDFELLHAAGRPSSLQHLRNLSAHIGGAQIYLKREDLSSLNTHSTMMVAGQALLARRLGCKTLVTSSVNGCRGLTTAAIAAQLDLGCVVYMDARDSRRNFRDVFRMSLMEADLQTTEIEGLRNHDIREAALQHWASDPQSTFLVTGLDAVPAPYPAMHREFTSAIGRECKRQMQARARRMPDVIVARGQGTTDALGLFPPFLNERGTRLVCVDSPVTAPAQAHHEDDEDSAPLTEAELRLAPDIIEGIHYPSVAREHGWLKASGRVEYVEVDQDLIRQAISDLARLEGVIPSLAVAEPLAWACIEARQRESNQAIVVMVSQNGDNDLVDIGHLFGVALDGLVEMGR